MTNKYYLPLKIVVQELYSLLGAAKHNDVHTNDINIMNAINSSVRLYSMSKNKMFTSIIISNKNYDLFYEIEDLLKPLDAFSKDHIQPAIKSEKELPVE